MQILGIYFDRPYLQMAIVNHNKKIQSLHVCLPPDPFDVKQLYMPRWRGKVATGFNLLTRHLDFKISSVKKIEQGIPFQIESLTHAPLEELVFVPQISVDEKGGHATVFLSPKERLQAHLDEWKKRSVEPDFVTGVPAALAAFTAARFPGLSSFFIIHLGSYEWIFTWIEGGQVHKTFTLSEGIEHLMIALWEDRKKVLFQKEIDEVAQQMDLCAFNPSLYPNLAKQLDKTRNNLSATLLSFLKGGGPSTVFFSGRVGAFGNLAPYLLQQLPECSLYEPASRISKDELHCAVAIGCAYESLAKKGVQFLSGEFVPNKAWRKAGRWGLGLLTFSLLASVSFLLANLSKSGEEKSLMARALSAWVEKIDPPAEPLSIDEMIERIDSHDRPWPYLVQTPTVTEVLSWVSTDAAALELIDFQYQLLSYPHVGALKEPYSAKVTLEFQAQNPTTARKFHEILLQGRSIADPSKEISWDSLPHSYRTSFFLKNRPAHGR